MRDLTDIERDVLTLERELQAMDGEGYTDSAVERTALLRLLGRLDQLEAELIDVGKKLGLIP